LDFSVSSDFFFSIEVAILAVIPIIYFSISNFFIDKKGKIKDRRKDKRKITL
jgi:hypothetical protein